MSAEEAREYGIIDKVIQRRAELETPSPKTT
jgi:ATP-dependent protease ClpP protease subunit